MDLSANSGGKVRVFAEDLDVFLMSQREAVEALADRQRTVSTIEDFRRQFSDLLVDAAQWSKEHGVQQTWFAPRSYDWLFVVIAPGEDENSDLYSAMAAFELAVFEKYPRFSLSFLMLRASEADGIDSFIDPARASRVYTCPSNRPT